MLGNGRCFDNVFRGCKKARTRIKSVKFSFTAFKRWKKNHLGSGDEEEACGQQKSLQRGLPIGELDPLQIEHRLRVSQDQRIQSQDLEHLERGDQRASALLDDVVDAHDGAQLGGERRGHGRVAQLHDLERNEVTKPILF